MIAQEERGPPMMCTGNDGGEIVDPQQNHNPTSPLTCEELWLSSGSRRAGPGSRVIGKPYRGRQGRMTTHNDD